MVSKLSQEHLEVAQGGRRAAWMTSAVILALRMEERCHESRKAASL